MTSPWSPIYARALVRQAACRRFQGATPFPGVFTPSQDRKQVFAVWNSIFGSNAHYSSTIPSTDATGSGQEHSNNNSNSNKWSNSTKKNDKNPGTRIPVASLYGDKNEGQKHSKRKGPHGNGSNGKKVTTGGSSRHPSGRDDRNGKWSNNNNNFKNSSQAPQWMTKQTENKRTGLLSTKTDIPVSKLMKMTHVELDSRFVAGEKVLVKFDRDMNMNQRFAAITAARRKERMDARALMDAEDAAFRDENNFTARTGLKPREVKQVKFIGQSEYSSSLSNDLDKSTLALRYQNYQTEKTLITNPTALLPFSKNKIRKTLKYGTDKSANEMAHRVETFREEIFRKRDDILEVAKEHDEVFDQDSDILIPLPRRSSSYEDTAFGDQVVLDPKTGEISIGVVDPTRATTTSVSADLPSPTDPTLTIAGPTATDDYNTMTFPSNNSASKYGQRSSWTNSNANHHGAGNRMYTPRTGNDLANLVGDILKKDTAPKHRSSSSRPQSKKPTKPGTHKGFQPR